MFSLCQHQVFSPLFAGQLGWGETRNIRCSQVHSWGFVSVYMEHSGFLTLCEVQVFGSKSSGKTNKSALLAIIGKQV